MNIMRWRKAMVRHMRGIKNKRLLSICIRAALINIFFIIFSQPVSAKVTGVCSNCHTMHNSQNGNPVAIDGAGVGWDGSGNLTGGSTSGPMNQLLVTSCVGCHTSTTTSTIVNFGSSKIPIVYNTQEPLNPLAGGNFYWVAQGGSYDAYGHNVYGIAAPDGTLTSTVGAPGRVTGLTCGSATSCHMTLSVAKDTMTYRPGGCQGCHTQTAHHDDSKPWYRFLKGHQDTVDYVAGIEDPNWEQNPTLGHNKYKGYNGPVPSSDITLEETKSMSSFCGGCHGKFHRGYYTGSSTPWLRHPTDIRLPDSGEYAGYDPVSNYSAEAPVAWTDPANPTRATAVVMCLSCHRPHGSNQPDLLRWKYDDIIAGGGGSGGCFICHTSKD